MRPGPIETPRLRWTVLILSGCGVLHFVVSLGLWTVLLKSVWSLPGKTRGETMLCLLAQAGPAVGLLVAFAIAFALAGVRRRAAIVWLVAAVVLSAGALVCDVSKHRYQIHVTTTHGSEHAYCTWWWLDDRWLEPFGFER